MLKSDDSSNILVNTRDGKKYYIKDFNSAGVWMVENLAYIPTESGYIEQLGGGEINDKTWSYTFQDTPIKNPNSLGVLYSWNAATNNENLGISQGEGGVNSEPINIKGVCPDGWHIPTDTEWNTLFRVIYNNPQSYSSYIYNFNPAFWNSADNTIIGAQGVADNISTLGLALSSSCFTSIPDIYRLSKPAKDGGFDAIAAGILDPSGNYVKSITQWWSSSAHIGNTAYYRYLSSTDRNAYRGNTFFNYKFSIRCKKD